jgi:SulP family sulfate permease
MVKAIPDIDVVVIRMGKVPYVDQSGLYAMEDAILDLQSQDIKVVFTKLHGQPLDMFENFDIIPDLIPERYNFKDFKSCYRWLENYIEKGIDTLAIEEPVKEE